MCLNEKKKEMFKDKLHAQNSLLYNCVTLKEEIVKATKQVRAKSIAKTLGT